MSSRSYIQSQSCGTKLLIVAITLQRCKEEQESSVVLVLFGSTVPPNPDPLSKTLNSLLTRSFGFWISDFSLGRKHLAWVQI